MRKRKDVTLYDGGFLVLIVIVAIVFLIGVVKENLKRDSHFYDINWEQSTNINWGQWKQHWGITGHSLKRNTIYDSIKEIGNYSDRDMNLMGFDEYKIVPEYGWVKNY